MAATHEDGADEPRENLDGERCQDLVQDNTSSGVEKDEATAQKVSRKFT